jgi:hypothetical protein
MHVVEVERKLTRGTEEKAQELLTLDKGCKEFNTSFIERLNGTFRERLASLTGINVVMQRHAWKHWKEACIWLVAPTTFAFHIMN